MEGTIEIIAQELTKLIRPLKDDLHPKRARFLFAELGFNLSESQVNSLSAPFNTTITNTETLIDESQALVAAIEAEDLNEIIQKGTKVVNAAKVTIDGFIDLKNGINGLGLSGVSSQMINAIPEKLFNYLFVRYLDRLKGITPIISFLGILEQIEENVGSANPDQPQFTRSEFHFDKITNWLSNPGEELKTLYKWNDNAFNGLDLFRKLEDILSRQGLPVILDESGPLPKLDLILIQAEPNVNVTPKGVLLKLKHEWDTAFNISGDNFDMGFDVDFNMPLNTELLIQPNGISITPPPSSPNISGKALMNLVVKEKISPAPFVILGQAGGSRFEVEEFILKVGSELSWNTNKAEGEFFFDSELNGGKIVIELGEADGFLQNIMPEGGIEGNFDLAIGWSSEHGVYFKGGGGLEIDLSTHITLGPVEINGLQIGINLSSEGIPINLSTSITANLGPFVAVIEKMGITANFDFAESNNGNLGPIDFGMGFKPPNGIGLSLDAGVVKGGGYLYFDFEKEEYAGALELAIQDTLVVTAIGVVTTRMPDGSKGFSLLLMISVQFSPGIALGFGFFLTGLGGLIGLNRTVNVEALRLGVKSGTLDNILFPEDVVKNISKIISDIREIFPPKQDQFILGLMAQITWGVPKLITVEFGVLIEFQSPVRIAILGVLKCILPTEDQDLIRIQVAFLGIIDFDNKYLSFDASIFNSKILTFTLEGDMALRINWGDKPDFLMSVGGFHPSFKPEASLGVSNMKRLTLNLLSGNPRLTLTTYFAITSNTVQFGANIDFLFKVSKFKVIGYFGFDVLFQFSPFKFIANIRAGIEIKLGSTTLFSISLEFELQGPTPWIASGTASFKILFFTIKVKFKKTFGEKKNSTLPAVAVMPQVLEALNAQPNWISVIPKNRYSLVSMREDGELEGEIVLNPFGTLTVSQSVLPLGLDISKFGNFRPQDLSKLSVAEARIGSLSVPFTSVKDNFAPANFKEMEDNDKLKSPSFVKEDSGVKLTGTEELHMNYHINRPVQYEVITSDHKPESATPFTFIRFDQLLGANMDAFKLSAKGGAIAHAALSQENKLKQSIKKSKPVSLVEDEFKVVSAVDLTQIAGIDFAGGSKAQATDALRSFVKANPEMKDKVQMVPSYQLQD
ncbi:DUF6603 domain-containing protein [uncultured Kriegella sp.]|uniref:DUF6603 domain-containing protein n=1 Tax=uncultured Kriegella sp. TaxID=1798910 RepID=UPI0030DAA6F1|tara:strand:- start:82315 stop:85728 length:3414 start_codon:yes stop_codon:yes gene_type:complete